MQYLIPVGLQLHHCQCGQRVVYVEDGDSLACVEYNGGDFPHYGDVHVCNVGREQLFAVEFDTSGLPTLNDVELDKAKLSLSRRFNHVKRNCRPLAYKFKAGRVKCEFCGADCTHRIALLCNEIVYELDVCDRHQHYNGSSPGVWPKG